MESRLAELEKEKAELYGKDFLLTGENSAGELKAVVDTAEILKEIYESNISAKIFRSGLAVSVFRDKSTRTRLSFASGANMLGLEVQEIDEKKTQISHGETVRETAVMLSFMSEVIGIRDDMFLGRGNKYMREVATALSEAHKSGVLHQRPSIINLQCDVDHPTQTLADLAYLKEQFGSLENLRGKKIAVTWAYSPSYGKPLSVAQGLITLLTRYGMNVQLAHPPGYELMEESISEAKKNAKESNCSFSITNSMEEAFKDADIVYPKSWAPLSVMKKRTELLEAGDGKNLDALEKECLENNARFKNWECNEKMMKLTKNGSALYMHCLPADISGVSCAQGEVSKGVFEKYRLKTYEEASFKPFVIAAMILLSRFEKPARVLEEVAKRKMKRRGMTLG
ncbi:MAG: knotted carbamoyltransferase YgeW [Candidatus Micrarchaeota archaeon]